MRASQADKRFVQLVQKMDPQSKLLRTWQLQEGISAQVTALEIARSNGQTQKMIVRQHGAINTMQSFTHHYASMTTIDLTNLPYWDLCAALRPASKISE